MSFAATAKTFVRDVLSDATRTMLVLFKAMIPAILLVKLAAELGLISYVALPLAPLMHLVDLPPELGVVWASALLVNLYTAIAAYAALVPFLTEPVSTAQITALSTMLLMAHALPVECRITRECGAGFWLQVGFRILAATVCGLAVSLTFKLLGVYQQPAVLLFTPEQRDPSLLAWALGQLRGLALLGLLIVGVMALIRLLRIFGVLERINGLFAPLLRLIGIGREAATITVVGLSLGLIYGSGLIVSEARSGNVSRKDVVASVTFMSICHALVEDTLLMALLGATAWGTLGFRVLVSALLVALFVRLFAAYERARSTPPGGPA